MWKKIWNDENVETFDEGEAIKIRIAPILAPEPVKGSLGETFEPLTVIWGILLGRNELGLKMEIGGVLTSVRTTNIGKCSMLKR